MWGTDATIAYTRDDGRVWAFCCIDHFSCEAWTGVAKRGDRFACLEPIYDAITDRFGNVDRNLARGIALRHDWGPQYTSGHFQGALRRLGIEDSPAFAGELHATAAQSVSSERSRNSACGPSSMTTSRNCVRPSSSSPVATTTSGSSNDTDTRPRARLTRPLSRARQHDG